MPYAIVSGKGNRGRISRKDYRSLKEATKVAKKQAKRYPQRTIVILKATVVKRLG